MNKELSTVLRNKLIDMPFIDLAAGMVQTLTTTEVVGDDGKTVTKRMPVSYDVVPANTCTGKEVLMLPDSSRKSILYFEDFGITPGARKHGLTEYNSNLRLIFWMNRANLVGDDYAEVSGRCMATIIDTITGKNPENIGMFIRLRIDVAKIQPQDAGLFGRYTYDEPLRQYLRPPFEFFGIDFSCKYQVPAKCLNGINWNLQKCY